MNLEFFKNINKLIVIRIISNNLFSLLLTKKKNKTIFKIIKKFYKLYIINIIVLALIVLTLN